jgi:hypothetical protein
MKQLIGLLRDKTPKFMDGTIGADIARMVKTFGRGMFVDVVKPKPMLGESRGRFFKAKLAPTEKVCAYRKNLPSQSCIVGTRA